MRVHVFCSDRNHPVFPYLERWQTENSRDWSVDLLLDESGLTGGDILFLVSVDRLVPRDVRERYRAAIVLHASDLPRGRGWSPLVWQVLEGAKAITVSAVSAEDKVDSGDIWLQQVIQIEEHEVFPEICHKLFLAEIALMERIAEEFGSLQPVPQSSDGATYYRKRTPEDSRLDPHSSLASQFDLLRLCDPVRYPAFLDLRGHRYRLVIEKLT